ncbi:MAG: M48 family metalloprotease [Planctomycetes bacterium]|nr:M48 family metalloprotease [Planctomycetota bacterium]
MITVLLSLAGALALAALAEASPLEAAPRPLGWAAAALAFPAAWALLAKALPPRLRDLGRAILFLLAYAAVLWPLGWAAWALHDLGWLGKPLRSTVLLLLPAAALGAPAGRALRLAVPPIGVLLLVAAAVEATGAWPALLEAVESSPCLEAALAALGLAALFAASPFLVQLAWPSKPLPRGPLLERVGDLARRLGIERPEVRVWDPGRGLALNACAAGLLPRARKVFFTHGLRLLLDDEEQAAVFCHEAAHFALGHLWAFLLLAVSFVFSLPPLASLLEPAPEPVRWAALLAYGAAYWGLLSGAAARRLEAEADLAAAEAVGPDAYLRALGTAASHSSGGGRRGGLRHWSLARRIELVEAAAEPGRARAELERMRRLRRRFWAIPAAAAVAFAAALAGELSLPAGPAALATARAAVEAAEELRPLLERHGAGALAVPRWLAWAARPSAAIEAEALARLAGARERLEAAGGGALAPEARQVLERAERLERLIKERSAPRPAS